MCLNVRYWWLLRHGYTWHAPGVVSQRTSQDIECAVCTTISAEFYTVPSCRHVLTIGCCIAKLLTHYHVVQNLFKQLGTGLQVFASSACHRKPSNKPWEGYCLPLKPAACFSFALILQFGGQSPTNHPIGVNLGVKSTLFNHRDGVINVSQHMIFLSHVQKGDVICSKSLDLNKRFSVCPSKHYAKDFQQNTSRGSRPMLHATNAICHILPRDL